MRTKKAAPGTQTGGRGRPLQPRETSAGESVTGCWSRCPRWHWHRPHWHRPRWRRPHWRRPRCRAETRCRDLRSTIVVFDDVIGGYILRSAAAAGAERHQAGREREPWKRVSCAFPLFFRIMGGQFRPSARRCCNAGSTRGATLHDRCRATCPGSKALLRMPRLIGRSFRLSRARRACAPRPARRRRSCRGRRAAGRQGRVARIRPIVGDQASADRRRGAAPGAARSAQLVTRSTASSTSSTEKPRP